MTNQEIFDTAVTHLRKQNRKSIDETKNCLYRGPDGTKCAVGCFIPDDKYSSRMEGESIDTLGKEYLFIRNLFSAEQICMLLSDIQTIHDLSSVVDWESEFDELATSYHLTYTPPNK